MQTFLNIFFEKNAVWVHNFLTYVYFAFKMEKLTVSLSFLFLLLGCIKWFCIMLKMIHRLYSHWLMEKNKNRMIIKLNHPILQYDICYYSSELFSESCSMGFVSGVLMFSPSIILSVAASSMLSFGST